MKPRLLQTLGEPRLNSRARELANSRETQDPPYPLPGPWLEQGILG